MKRGFNVVLSQSASQLSWSSFRPRSLKSGSSIAGRTLLTLGRLLFSTESILRLTMLWEVLDVL